MSTDHAKLTHLEHIILATFITHKRTTKTLSCAAIANHTGYSPWAIYRSLKPLTIARLVTCIHRGTNFQTNIYTLAEQSTHTSLTRLPDDTEAFVEHYRLMNRLTRAAASAKTTA